MSKKKRKQRKAIKSGERLCEPDKTQQDLLNDYGQLSGEDILFAAQILQITLRDLVLSNSSSYFRAAIKENFDVEPPAWVITSFAEKLAIDQKSSIDLFQEDPFLSFIRLLAVAIKVQWRLVTEAADIFLRSITENDIEQWKKEAADEASEFDFTLN